MLQPAPVSTVSRECWRRKLTRLSVSEVRPVTKLFDNQLVLIPGIVYFSIAVINVVFLLETFLPGTLF